MVELETSHQRKFNIKEIPCPVCNKVVQIWYEPAPTGIGEETKMIAMSFIDHFNKKQHSKEELGITLAGMIAFEVLERKVFMKMMIEGGE